MRMLFAACAIVLLIGAPAAAQQFPPAQVTPHGQLERARPNLNGTWDVLGGLPGQLTLAARANEVMTGNFWPYGVFNNARFPCWGQYSETAYTFVVLCRAQQYQPMIFVGRGEAEGVGRTRLFGHYHLQTGGSPPGGLTDWVFEGRPVP